MKRILMVLLSIATFATLASAQVTYDPLVGGTPIGASTPIDKLGAHNNGGRGCVGCHAPHSGARGNGGNAIDGTVLDTETGNWALWGQDMGPLASQSFEFGGTGGEFAVNFPAIGDFYTAVNEPITAGIMTCLSCHDGNIAKGAMMTNQSWEQQMGLLPTTYGTGIIPTLLGNDGTAAGNYANDHPVGMNATLGSVGNVASRWTVTNGKYSTTDAQMLEFIDNYGAPQFLGRTPPVLPDGFAGGTPTDAYLVCTTCHTPHTMYTFNASGSNKIAGQSSGTFASFFFINAPYNPTSAPTTGEASSVAQFCRQCHFRGAGGSNEASNINNVATAF
jgi:cytochrome c553